MESTGTIRKRKGNRIDEALCEPKNVRKFLTEYPSLVELIRSKDDESFHDTVMDFMVVYEEALELSTPKQVEAVELFRQGFNQREIGEMIGVKKQSIQRLIKAICERIAQQYRAKLIK